MLQAQTKKLCPPGHAFSSRSPHSDFYEALATTSISKALRIALHDLLPVAHAPVHDLDNELLQRSSVLRDFVFDREWLRLLHRAGDQLICLQFLQLFRKHFGPNAAHASKEFRK